jgi:hypothetical protein
VIVLAIHGRSIGYGFVRDDHELIEQSARLHDLSTLPTALTKDLFWLADGHVRPSPYWRPVTTLSYYADQALGGGPLLFHVTNLALVVIVAGLASRLVEGKLVRLLVVAGVVCHPLMVEPASNISARTDLLAATFALLALETGGVAAFICTLLALGSKEVAVMLPVVALALRRPWIPSALAVVGWVAVRFPLVHALGVARDDAGWPTVASVVAAPFRLTLYLFRALVPLHPTPALLLPEPSTIQAVASWGTVALLAFVLVRRRELPARHFAMGLLALIPVTGFLASPVRYAEGFLVWPVVGLVAGAGSIPALLVALVPFWAIHSWQSSTQWTDDRTLWETAHAHWPDDPIVAGNLARTRLAQGEIDSTLALLDQARAGDRDPRHQRELELATGQAWLAMGSPEQALPHLRAAVGALDDPEATPAIVALCIVGTRLGERDLEDVCAEAQRRAGTPPPPSGQVPLASDGEEGAPTAR